MWKYHGQQRPEFASDLDSDPVDWSYPDPNPHFAELKDCVSFYRGRVDCCVNDERALERQSR